MLAVIVPLVSKFDDTDKQTQTLFQAMVDQSNADNVTISDQISTLFSLLSQTLALQQHNNAALSATVQVLQQGLVTFTATLNFAMASVREVLDGLGIQAS